MKSLLFVPGHLEKYLTKAYSSNASAIIFDLEDAVPSQRKDEARRHLPRLNELVGNKKVIVRINAFESSEYWEDIKAVTKIKGIDFVMPVKCQSVEELSKTHKNIGLPMIPLIETAYAAAFVNEIALLPFVEGIALGAEDLMDDLKVKSMGYEDFLLEAKMKVSLAAKLKGIHCFDTPFLALDDLDGYAKSCRHSYGLGFGGRLCIHPSQIDFTNQYYYPSLEEQSFAREIQQKLSDAKDSGYSVIRWKGELVGPPMIKRAMTILKEIEND